MMSILWLLNREVAKILLVKINKPVILRRNKVGVLRMGD